MGNFLRKLMVLLMALNLSYGFAQVVTIPAANTAGTGNSTVGRKPYGNWWGYERSAAIYTAAEVGYPGTISALGFYVESLSSPADSTPVKIYLKHSPSASFGSAATYASEIASASLVFSGNIYATDLVAGAWITTTLDSTFFYNGTQNLVVLVETNGGSTGIEGQYGKQFRYSTQGSNSFQYWQTDNTPPSSTGTLGSARTNIQLTIAPAPTCSGTPTAGTVSGPASVCAGSAVSLSLSGQTSGVAGITIQWQKSSDSLVFTNKPYNANAATTTDTISTKTYYRVVVKCGTDSAISNVLGVGISAPTACYCVPPLSSGCSLNDLINSFSISSLVNSGSGCNGQANSYINYPESQFTTTLIEGVTYSASVTAGTGSGTHGAAIWIDFNQNGSFADSNEFFLISNSIAANATATNNLVTIPAGITPGKTRLRVRYVYSTTLTLGSSCTSASYGETEDYTVTLSGPVTCTNPPAAGTVTANKTKVCANDSTVLSATGYELGASLQWQVSTDSLSWSDVPSATLASVTSQPVTAPVFYRLKVTCIDSTFSNAVKLETKLCYCASYATNSADTKIDSVFFNTIVTGSPLSTCQTYTDYTNLSTTVQRLVQYPLTVKNGYCGGTHYPGYLGVFVDWNQDGDFADADETVYTFGPTTARASIPVGLVSVPDSAKLGSTTMRVVFREGSAPAACGTYGYGETEDYTIEVTAAPPCNTPTVGGTISGPDSAEANTTGVFVVNGYSGTNFSWEISNSPTGPFTVLGVDNDSLTLLLNAVGTFYGRVKVLANGCASSYSDTFSIVITLSGDEPCNAITANLGKNGPFDFTLYTTSANEVRPLGDSCEVQTRWCDADVAQSVWLKFQAPASGRVYMRAPGGDNRLALWDASDCAGLADSTLGGYTLLAANDDDPNYLTAGSEEYSAFIDTVECLVPGKFYYVQLAPNAWFGQSTDTTSFFLEEAPAKDASFVGMAQAVYCEDASAETLYPATPGGVFSGTGVNNGNEFDPSIAGVGGPYIVTYTLNGCYTFSDTASVSAIPDIASVTIEDIKCFGQQDGSVAITMASGTAPFTFNWSNGTNDSLLANVGAGQYQATITSADNCSSISAQYVVTDSTTALTATTTATDVKCFGNATGSVTVTVQGGEPAYTYAWSNSGTADSVSGVAAGSYSVTVTDKNGCTTTAQDTVSEPASALSATSVATDQVGATNGTITVTATGGTPSYQYAWSNGDTAQNLTAVAGVYTLTVTDANNCTFVLTDTINFVSGVEGVVSGVRRISLYPNPTVGAANLEVELENEKPIGVEVFDAFGKLVLVQNIAAAKHEVISLDMNGFAAGLYSVRVKVAGAFYTKQISIQR